MQGKVHMLEIVLYYNYEFLHKVFQFWRNVEEFLKLFYTKSLLPTTHLHIYETLLRKSCWCYKAQEISKNLCRTTPWFLDSYKDINKSYKQYSWKFCKENKLADYYDNQILEHFSVVIPVQTAKPFSLMDLDFRENSL